MRCRLPPFEVAGLANDSVTGTSIPADGDETET